MNVIFDLDGPILDVRDRFYNLYKRLMKKYGARRILAKDRYWELKKRRTPLEKLAAESKLPADKIGQYRKERLALIEDKEYLQFDKVHKKALKVIKGLSRGNALYLATLRNRRRNLLWELKRLGMNGLFKNILSEDKNSGDVRAKYRLIKNSGINILEKTILIGDTEVDITVAKKIGAVSVAVLSGIRTAALLRKAEPDYIIKDITKIGELNLG